MKKLAELKTTPDLKIVCSLTKEIREILKLKNETMKMIAIEAKPKINSNS